jgi:hypothetical protein
VAADLTAAAAVGDQSGDELVGFAVSNGTTEIAQVLDHCWDRMRHTEPKIF